jgi:hypothetical protein
MINMRSCSILCVLAAAVRLTESFSPLAAGGGRPTTFLVPQQSLTSLQQQEQVAIRSSFSVRLSAIDDSSSESSDAAPDNDESTSDSSASVPAPAAPAAPRNPNANPKRIDPLMASLMRSTPETKAPIRNLPILGEVAMDQSVYLVAFAVVFGILGLVFSIYVGISNQEAFTEALKANPYLQSAGSAPDGEGCRGICSSQQDDLDQLRVFMNGLGK